MSLPKLNSQLIWESNRVFAKPTVSGKSLESMATAGAVLLMHFHEARLIVNYIRW